MERPRLLDLFCGAGGSSVGFDRAGFEVTGVDIRPQPHYPFQQRCIQADALEYLTAHGHEFSAIAASPPCQAFTAYRRRGAGVGENYPDLIGVTRDLLRELGGVWVIENVPGAPLCLPAQLCGSSFGLDIRRHRLFETSWPIFSSPECDHGWQTPRFPQATNRTNLRSTVEVGVRRIPLDIQRRAMDIDWMTREELSQAIPPAYTRWLGEQMHTARASQQTAGLPPSPASLAAGPN